MPTLQVATYPKVSIPKVDRLAIICSSPQLEHEQLLAIQPLPAGTGRATAEALSEVVEAWDLTENVVGLSYDTTSSNTGGVGGSVTLFEQR